MFDEQSNFWKRLTHLQLMMIKKYKRQTVLSHSLSKRARACANSYQKSIHESLKLTPKETRLKHK